MTFEDVLKQTNRIFIREFDNPDIVLTAETTARDVPEWDSLMQINLVVATEKHFGVRFTSTEIQGFQSVGDMCRSILAKLG